MALVAVSQVSPPDRACPRRVADPKNRLDPTPFLRRQVGSLSSRISRVFTSSSRGRNSLFREKGGLTHRQNGAGMVTLTFPRFRTWAEFFQRGLRPSLGRFRLLRRPRQSGKGGRAPSGIAVGQAHKELGEHATAVRCFYDAL